MRIEVHIDRVVLDGVGDARQVRVIQEALQAELTRLLAHAPRATNWSESQHRRLDGQELRSARFDDPGILGRGIARSVHAGIATPTYKAGLQ